MKIRNKLLGGILLVVLIIGGSCIYNSDRVNLEIQTKIHTIDIINQNLNELEISLAKEFREVEEYANGYITREEAEKEIGELEEKITQHIETLYEKSSTEIIDYKSIKQIDTLIKNEDKIRENVFKKYDQFITAINDYDKVVEELTTKFDDLNKTITNKEQIIALRDVEISLAKEFREVEEYANGYITREEAEKEIGELEEIISTRLQELNNSGIDMTEIKELINKEDNMRITIFDYRIDVQQNINEFDEISEEISNTMNMIRHNINKISADSSKKILSMLNLNILILAIVIVLSIGVSYLIFHPISRQIEKLRNATEKISKGDFTIKLETHGTDEIAQLTNDVNKMTKGLETQQEKLLMTEKLYTIGKLASRLSHDLRNPLGVIKLTVEMLSRPNIDSELEKKYRTIDEAVLRMQHQIQHVLNYVKNKTLELENNSIRTILDTVLESIEIPDNIQIKKPENDVKVMCDSNMFNVVFVNLITNAIQAIGKNKGTITIRISEKDDKLVVIEIEDSGPGIPEDNISKVFEPLFTTKQEGTGLGLVSCKSILNQHNGTISVRNHPTTFTISLPKNQPKNKTENTKNSD